jgi:hypothetical protein
MLNFLNVGTESELHGLEKLGGKAMGSARLGGQTYTLDKVKCEGLTLDDTMTLDDSICPYVSLSKSCLPIQI